MKNLPFFRKKREGEEREFTKNAICGNRLKMAKFSLEEIKGQRLKGVTKLRRQE